MNIVKGLRSFDLLDVKEALKKNVDMTNIASESESSVEMKIFSFQEILSLQKELKMTKI